MKLMVLLKPHSEFAGITYDFIRDFQSRTGKTVEVISVDSKPGYTVAELYDIVEYPCIMAVTDGGEMLQIWQGSQLPLIDEVSAYV
jgi:hypothetical protein